MVAIALSLLMAPGNSANAAAATKAKTLTGPTYASSDVSPLPATATPLDHNNRAVSLGRRGLWEQAVKEHEFALNGDPYNPTFRMNLSGAYLRYGQSLMAKRSWQQAIEKFHMALYVDPNNIPAADGLSTCWKSLGKDPDKPEVRKELGETYDGEGNYPAAIAEYRCYVRITDSGQAHAALGQVLIKQGQSVPARAVEGFQELKIAVGKDWPKDQQMELAFAHLHLADLLKDLAYKARDTNRSQTALVRLTNAAIEYRRAATIFNGRNLEGARGLVEVAREAAAINPNSFENRLMLAGGYQLLGDFDRAKKEYENCWRLRPSDPRLGPARLSYHLAVVTSAAASPMQVAYSVQKVEDLLRKNPNDAELLYVYGRGKDQLGDHDVAMQAYRAAYQINPYINTDLSDRLGVKGPPMKTAQQGASAGQALAFGAPPGAPATSGAAPGAQPGQQPQSQLLPGQQPPQQSGFQPGSSPQQPSALPGVLPPPAVDPNSAMLSAIQNKMTSGDVDGAQKQLLALLDKDPKQGKAWYMLGTTQEKKGELDDASVAYRQASYLLKNDQESSNALRRVNTSRAITYLKEADKDIGDKNLQGAKDALRQAVSVAPEDLTAHRALLDVLKQLGDKRDIEQESNVIDKLTNPGQAPRLDDSTPTPPTASGTQTATKGK
jgi:tetratricopeptide (TPR) repeat protein